MRSALDFSSWQTLVSTLPAYLNGHPDGMLIEAPAGLLDGDDLPRNQQQRRRQRQFSVNARETSFRTGAATRLVAPGIVIEIAERGRQTVGAVLNRHTAERPKGVLQADGKRGETLAAQHRLGMLPG